MLLHFACALLAAFAVAKKGNDAPPGRQRYPAVCHCDDSVFPPVCETEYDFPVIAWKNGHVGPDHNNPRHPLDYVGECGRDPDCTANVEPPSISCSYTSPWVEGVPLYLDCSATTDPEGLAVMFTFNWGDGFAVSSNDGTAAHTYTVPAGETSLNLNITVKATDSPVLPKCVLASTATLPVTIAAFNEDSCFSKDASGFVIGCSNAAYCEGATVSYYTGPPLTRGVGECSAGIATCSAGVVSIVNPEVLPTLDECGDGLDEDCNGVEDDGCLGDTVCNSFDAVCECPGGKIQCSPGVCIDLTTEDNCGSCGNFCPQGFVCFEGACTELFNFCQNDTDCPSGQVCGSGTCVPAGDPCSTDGDCPSGQGCNVDVCETFVIRYVDGDGDGFGNPGTGYRVYASQPLTGVDNDDDCDDADAAVYPGAPLQCGKDANCDGQPDFDLTADDANCGACGNVCQGDLTCGNSTCACPQGETECSPGVCEVLTTDLNCGSCGNACVGGKVCDGASCVCPVGLDDCLGTCTNLTTTANCGACGVSCTGGKVCDGTQCVCPAGLTDCGGSCVDLAEDDFNCGSCNFTCPIATMCEASACVTKSCVEDADCPTGYGCNVDVCETFVIRYVDGDSDGFGNDSTAYRVYFGEPVTGVSNGDDCDDGDATVYPGAPLQCGKDANCDGQLDPVPLNTTDNCGACGNVCPVGETCVNSTCQTVSADPCTVDNDCAAPSELCDFQAGLCSATIKMWVDADGDTWGTVNFPPVVANASLSLPPGYARRPGDCDDSDNSIFPNGVHQCGQFAECMIPYSRAAHCPNGGTTAVCNVGGNGLCTSFDFPCTVNTDCSFLFSMGDPSGACGPADPTPACTNFRVTCNLATNTCDEFYQAFPDNDNDTFGTDALGPVPALRWFDGVPVPQSSLRGDDCDDTDATVYPGAPLQCGKDANCDGQQDVPLNTTANCGACGATCGGDLVCDGSSCVCPAGLTECSPEVCVDLTTDLNCGACGVGCAGDLSCNGTTCVCPPGQTECEFGTCRDLTSDVISCGVCFQVCFPGESCVNSVCQAPAVTNCTADIQCTDPDELCDFEAGVCSPTLTLWVDADGDTWGTVDEPTLLVNASGPLPAGYARRPGDCDDSDNSIFPNGVHQCGQFAECLIPYSRGAHCPNGPSISVCEVGGSCVDSVQCSILFPNCASVVSQGDPSGACLPGNPSPTCTNLRLACDLNVNFCDDFYRAFADNDNDTFGNSALGPNPALRWNDGVPVPLSSLRGDDCDDADPTVYPGAPLQCGKDANCDGQQDVPLDTTVNCGACGVACAPGETCNGTQCLLAPDVNCSTPITGFTDPSGVVTMAPFPSTLVAAPTSRSTATRATAIEYGLIAAIWGTEVLGVHATLETTGVCPPDYEFDELALAWFPEGSPVPTATFTIAGNGSCLYEDMTYRQSTATLQGLAEAVDLVIPGDVTYSTISGRVGLAFSCVDSRCSNLPCPGDVCNGETPSPLDRLVCSKYNANPGTFNRERICDKYLDDNLDCGACNVTCPGLEDCTFGVCV